MPYDCKTIERYRALGFKGSELDVEAKEAFEFLSFDDYPNLLREWEAKVERSWVYHKWWQAIGASKPFRVAYPDDLVACHETLGTVWTTCLKVPYSSIPYLDRITCDHYSLVKENS